MKRTKNLLMLMALALSVGLMSCDEQKLNEDVSPNQTFNQRSRLASVNNSMLNTTNIDDWQGVDASTLPQSIQDSLNSNYSGVAIEELWLTDTGEYVILLENDMVVIFNSSGAEIIAFDLGEILGDEDFDDEDWDWEDIAIGDLPQGIQDYITANYPNVKIEEAGIAPETGEYIVILDNGLCVIFDKDGNFLEEIDETEFDEEWDEVDPADLPQAIQDYVATNYAGATIEGAEVDPETGDYIVFLDNESILVFDENGAFLEEYDDEDFDDEDWEEIDAATLLQVIKDYLNANYADIAIEGAAVDKETGDIVVFLEDGTVVEFDKDGMFIEAYEDGDEYEDCVEVAIADLPQVIVTYITDNYADSTIVEAYYSEEDKEYYILLDNDTELIFDKDGNFLEADTGD